MWRKLGLGIISRKALFSNEEDTDFPVSLLPKYPQKTVSVSGRGCSTATPYKEIQ